MTPDEVATHIERVAADGYTIVEDAIDEDLIGHIDKHDPIELLQGDGALDMVWDAS